MASMRDIKRRRESIQSTGQITKAMKLVSTVKLQKAKGKAENTKPYFEHMYKAVNSMLRKSGNILHPYLQSGSSEKKGIIMVTSNRGLAGGYNSNIIKMVMNSGISKEDAVIYAVGKKGRDALARRGYTIAEDYSEAMDEPVFNDATAIGRKVLEDFAEGKIGEIYLVYTEFKNTVTHIPTWLKLLPVVVSEEEEEDEADKLTLMNYEPEAEEALDLIIPKYINSLIYGGLMQSFASENGARMQAMDSATTNAEEMISTLELSYNRARQGAITQELTEIIAGANAIN
ncbi:MAG: ATP synthase F1 subunit gamma [Lachnospiraceae bacterium]|nr:ATP synthase F1 subunit gamma [Lachnospiraceae bacterium]MBQ8547626.1 ATP synthase F1 subunit gamma [Lachnospiraceae bacterium]